MELAKLIHQATAKKNDLFLFVLLSSLVPVALE
jgi:hypothetical protein